MRKNINKLATLVMTGALAASMSFSAFAVEAESVVGTGKTMTVHKKVTTDGKTYAPNGSFSFTVEAADVTEKETKEFAGTDSDGNAKTETYDIKKGIAAALPEGSVTKAKFTPGELSSEYDATFTITFDETKFTTAGVYKYKLSEDKKFYIDDNTQSTVDYPGMKYDEDSYTMYVFVVNDGTAARKVSNVVIMNNDVKVNELKNEYGDNTTTDKVYDLTISKKIDGTLGNHSEGFTFDLSVKSDVAGENFKVVKFENGNETTTTYKLVDGGDALQLPVSETVSYRVYGLTDGDVVGVKEEEANQNGYKTTYALGSAAEITADDYTSVGTELDNTETLKVNVSGNGATLEITNKRDAVTPTGVAMDIAPYALMVALAGGAAATFLRKKESFED
ncbi:DUF7601 domain-containing protein [Oribacterium sp. FC2011]|uniref:DUF7601 domain-containing protein n=1 Tax=Oribacterium sp. FC2011 TaxID=1408311 RepID=UPI0004E0B98B|nr:hypothetical protein [Oribacterium sp. FC2011]